MYIFTGAVTHSLFMPMQVITSYMSFLTAANIAHVELETNRYNIMYIVICNIKYTTVVDIFVNALRRTQTAY